MGRLHSSPKRKGRQLYASKTSYIFLSYLTELSVVVERASWSVDVSLVAGVGVGKLIGASNCCEREHLSELWSSVYLLSIEYGYVIGELIDTKFERCSLPRYCHITAIYIVFAYTLPKGQLL